MTDRMLKKIIDIIGEDSIYKEELLKNHTTFRVGGAADYFLVPKSENEAVALLRLFCDEDENETGPYFILGRGSNLLVSDKGYRGTVISLDSAFSDIKVDDTFIYAEAGASLIKIASTALKYGLGGMEFASGIPGTLGGGITMNAGAYGGELKDIVDTVRLYDKEENTVIEKSCEEMDFSYRHSIVSSGRYVVLSAKLKLRHGDPSEIKGIMDELKEKRVSKQPLEYASAGSTFKRPLGYFAGKLIEDSGLKGYSVGDAQVSEKHCGFVINRGNATAEDILTLIRNVQDKVYDKFNVRLETEVCMLGFDE